MIDRQSHNRADLYVLAVVFILFAALQALGARLSDNGWSFSYWTHLPLWWPFAWGAGAVVLGLAVWRFGDLIGVAVARSATRWLVLVAVAALLVGLRIDSFVLDGGNLRVAQIGQTPVVVYPWYEFGSVALAHGLATLVGVFGADDSTAAVWGWRLLTYLTALACMVGAWRLAGEVVDRTERQFWAALTIFAGPALLLYFGYVGVSTVVVASTIWTAYFAVRCIRHCSWSSVAMMWGILVMGCVMHIGGIYLLPAVLAATVASRQNVDTARAALWVGFAAYLAMLVGVYLATTQHFSLARHLLFLSGKSPFGDYGLFDWRHLGDMVQVFLLAAPLVIVAKFLLWRKRESILRDPTLLVLVLMVLAGNTVVFIRDPYFGIPLDLPRLLPFLSPVGLLVAYLLARRSNPAGVTLRLGAIASLLVVTAWLPSYLSTGRTIDIAQPYLDRHDWYYRTGAVAFRDAFFYEGNLDRANEWDVRRFSRSSDLLNMKGVNNLIYSDRIPEAVNILYDIIARNRWWVEPRSILAGLQIEMGRFDRALAQVDTLQMIAPYRRETLMNGYIYHRERGDYYDALQAVNRAIRYYPDDREILSDKLLILHRMQDFQAAEAFAMKLIEEYPGMAYPHLILGFHAEARGDTMQAIDRYRQFLQLDSDAPEASRIKERMDALRAVQEAP